MSTSLLELKNVSRNFGGVTAIDGLNLDIKAGQLIGLIGPNGAGKTTLINLMTGVLRPTTGSIRLEGKDLLRLPPHRIARAGIARTYQIVQPFPHMSVLDNVAAAALFGGGASSFASAREAAREHLQFCGLEAVAAQSAGTLSLAGRKRLELARGLALKPKLLLLDEVNAGLNPNELDGAIALIRAIAARGVTILLTEHLMRLVLQVCQRIIVLHQGKLIADTTPGEVVRDAAVISAYFGERYAMKANHAGSTTTEGA
ncbi:ABC transporter ATP-binding protein [Noviherbaspirillum cavernae]|uniref:ABC transporter ATP-binding protein n=1 Tax=Noviherbaspirillum cavernae TaxID=2320862 RepID=A0A418WX21_9BURK|nr:ABC transporter ATP-binding protein [Noviherbaspirillum cavernae]RJG04780.1 ABC transporter ATP-binding protein [Noviherbaspirillum cavernae]